MHEKTSPVLRYRVALERCHKSCFVPEEAFAIALAAAFVLVEAACIHSGGASHSRHV